jgi:hypothetical protein
MRIVLLIFSLLLIAVALLYNVYGTEVIFFQPRPSRTWLGFIYALFTGELLYEAYYGPGTWSEESSPSCPMPVEEKKQD